jgi:hypothetical protein
MVDFRILILGLGGLGNLQMECVENRLYRKADFSGSAITNARLAFRRAVRRLAICSQMTATAG